MNRNSTVLVLAILPLAACGDGVSSAMSSQPVLRDSAGFTIVENEAPRWQGGEGWRIAPEPGVEIGLVDGPAGYQLDRVQHAARSSDGSIIVADGGSGQVRIFDGDGRYVLSMGGRGGGPGEFSTLSYAAPFGPDSIAAWDAATKRLTVFAMDGKVGRTWSVDGLDGLFVQTLGWFDDGSLALTVPAVPAAQQHRSLGEQRDQRGYVRVELTGTVDTLAVLPGLEHVFHGPNPPFGVGEILFARNAYAAVGNDVLVAGESGRHGFTVLSRDGSAQREVRLMAPARRVTAAELAEATARAAERQYRSARRMAEVMGRPVPERLPDVPYRDTHPFFDAIMLAADGHVWIREPTSPEGDVPQTWQVLDPAGAWLGAVETPARLRITEIGPDYILGIARDDYDVERVRGYQLIRSNGRR